MTASWTTITAYQLNQVLGYHHINYLFYNEKYIKQEVEVTQSKTTPLFGFNIRPTFTYAGLATLTLTGRCQYYHSGTTEQLLYSTNTITYPMASLATNDWNYFYWDDSAIVSSGSRIVTASQIIDSTTEPAFSPTKGGWYNGSDLCFCGLYADSNGLIEFIHSGGNYIEYANQRTGLSLTDIDTAWTDELILAPKFTNMARVMFFGESESTIWYWRTNGQSGATGKSINYNGDVAMIYFESDKDVITDSNNYIEVKASVSNTNRIGFYNQGFYLPQNV